MPSQADFIDGHILYSQVAYKPPNLTRLQGAMFMDRPDLWPINGRRRSKPVPPEQQPLLDSEDKAG
jgi:hypothetical protein